MKVSKKEKRKKKKVRKLFNWCAHSWRGFAEGGLHIVLFTVFWFNYICYRCIYQFAFILFLSFLTNQNKESGFQQVGSLVSRNIFAFCLLRVALYLTLIWVGFLGGSFWGGPRGADKLPPAPCLKLVRIMLETSHLAHKHTPIFSFRRYSFLCLALLNFADVSIFWQKISVFIQNSTFTQSNSVSCIRYFLVLF